MATASQPSISRRGERETARRLPRQPGKLSKPPRGDIEICRYLDSRTGHCHDAALPPEQDYSIGELAALAAVTPRTIRYYVSIGLLPSPGRQGPATRYGQAHLGRLRLIRRLQREHLPLGEIVTRLGGLDDDAVQHALRADASSEGRGSALDYIDHVRAGLARPDSELGSVAAAQPREELAIPAPAPPALRPAAVGPSQAPRSQWERVTLHHNVELHIRRPLSRVDQKRVERLIRLGREILEEGDQP